jgi:hypothetical protein
MGNVKKMKRNSFPASPRASSEQPRSVGIPMTEFVPSGYITIREALDRLGVELSPTQWTGQERTARTGLMSAEEAASPGTGASGSGMRPGRIIVARPLNTPVSKVAWTAKQKTALDDPFDPSYREERRAAQRFAPVSRQLRVLLEAGDLEAAIWDGETGKLHRVPVQTWRQHDADRMIKSGRAQIPPYGNIGLLLVKGFTPARVPLKPMPEAKIAEAAAALKEKTATENLTRPQQAEFVRQMFSDYHVTQRQLMEIFREVPVQKGRPTKSNKKV